MCWMKEEKKSGSFLYNSNENAHNAAIADIWTDILHWKPFDWHEMYNIIKDIKFPSWKE